MSEELTREEAHRAVDGLIEEVLEAAGICEPPVDALALARHLGVEPAPERGRRGRRPAVLAQEPSEERRQHAAALDLAEHFHEELLTRLGIDPEGPRPMLGESLAGLFASHLLLPADWLAGEARACSFDLFELKERFRTATHELIAWRLLDLDQPCVITLVDSEQVSRRRSNAWPVTKELAPVERDCLRQVQRYSRPCRLSDDGLDVRGWPIHTADWRREILRSVYEG